MSKDTRRKIMAGLVSVAVSLLMVEGLLRWFDPLGMAYFDDLRELAPLYEVRSDGLYSLPQGHYELSNFTITINARGDRVVPDTAQSDCQIVAIGDSVTWATAVNDDENFVNLLAQRFPDTEFINAGRSGYNIEQIYHSMAEYPDADGFVYLIVDNDTETAIDWQSAVQSANRVNQPSMLMRYIAYMRSVRQHEYVAVINLDHLQHYLSLILEYAPTRLFVFSPRLHGKVEHALDIQDAYTHVTNLVDSHPNPAGHRLIAEQMQAQVSELINEVCQ